MLSEEGNGKRSKRGAVSNDKPPREFRRQGDTDTPFPITPPCQARGANHGPFRPRVTSDSDRDLSDQPLSGHPRLPPGGTRCLQTPCTRFLNRVKPLLKRLAPVKVSPVVRTIAADPNMADSARILRSICGVGPVTSWILIAEMPELGQISGEQAAALTGLAPIAHDSGAMRAKRAIGGGRRALRHVLFQATLVS